MGKWMGNLIIMISSMVIISALYMFGFTSMDIPRIYYMLICFFGAMVIYYVAMTMPVER